MVRNVILDWSGTVVDDLPPTLEATNGVLRAHGVEELTREGFREHFRLPYPEFYAEWVPGVPLEELEIVYQKHFTDSEAAVTLLPGAREFLDFCRRSRRRVFVFSSIRRDHYEAHVLEFGLEGLIERGYAGVKNKEEGIGRMLEENGLAAEETIFVGDMTHDVAAAKCGGLRSVAVLTGYESHVKLAAAEPDMVVADLDVLRRMLGVVDPLETMPVATVGALISDREGRVLVVRTHKWQGKWGIPGGKIQRGETAEVALRRELREETGLEVDGIEFVVVQDCVEPDEFERSAHFLLLNYTARSLGGEVVLNDEAEEFKWVGLAESLELDLNGPTRVLVEELRRRR